ncbi:SNF2 family N-terminal domain-containing protein [Chaetomium sp. MPI-CAGE-AT-0009]|nr:SNF2 family N-terminal domain-containing protein [Chaetomium sp. MPI-CAGE-AT-0009]
MPRAKANGRSKSRAPLDVAMTASDHVAAFMECIQSIQPPGQEPPPRPTKRARISRVVDSICIARECLSVTRGDITLSQESSTTTRADVGQLVDVRLYRAEPEIPDTGGWQLSLKPRANYRGRGFALMLPVEDATVTQRLRTALHVAEVHAANPGEDSCLWAGLDISVRQAGDSIQLRLSTEVRWNERLTIWGSERSKSNSQQTLRDEVLNTWYPDLHKASRKPQSWSPQDFYEAACVPSKDELDEEVSAMEITGLEAVLYPFQRRAVQWLLRREGVHWHRDDPSKQTGIQPYVSPTSPALPISFAQAKDADGSTIYISALLGAATRDTSLFRPFQDLRGGILAEEMGLGKTLEMIALILLHQRPEGPVMVFDPFLERELLATSATLIVAPSSLLDQWLSELSRHAPGLKVMFYPGIKRLAQLKDENELSAERLAEQDVVVTTYDVLRKEIWAASDEPTRSMRNEQQYERVKSPLVRLSWWRVCIDEAQMVENWANNAAKLARKIPRINAWGVTGTPVKDDVQKDLRGLLLFLRHEPYASDTKTWNFLTTFDKESFRKIFNSISMRHSKSLVRNEIDIPPQKRYVITMPFTAVEEQHYQSLFEELAGTCGLDAQGNPLQDDWNPDDPEVQRSMRVALDRLRQTVLHPEVGNRNRRALGQRAGPMRTVAEVLDAMLEQTDSAVRTDQRAFLSAQLLKGQILACQKREQDALDVWREAAAKCSELVDESRAQLEQEIQEARRTKLSEDDEADGEGEDREDVVPPRVGEARRRLRLVLEIQHRAVFFCANAYFSMKSNEEATAPDSEEFKRLEKLEVEAYDRAKDIRREILQESHGKAAKLMDRLMKAATEQAFAVVPAFKSVDKNGIESRRIADALEELYVGLDEQAAEIDDWREHVIQLLLKPLVDEENDEITGEEYEQSTKLQEEILVYLQILRTALAYRNSSITGQKNFLVEHETKTAARRAAAGEGPSPEKFLELLRVCEGTKPQFVEGDPFTSLRGLVSELRTLSGKLQHDAGSESSRAARELAVVSALLKSTNSQQKEQAKAATAMEKEIERFMDTLNARIEYYRQLQEVSDTVAGYEGSLEADALDAALAESKKQEAKLEEHLDAAKAKHRYLVFLKDAESNSGEQRICIICQSSFEVGVLTVCGHLFCKECITLWLRAHRNCPMCKKKLHQYNLYDITLKPQELRVHSERQHGSGDGDEAPTTPSKKVSALYSEFNADQLAVIKNIDLDGPSFTTKVDMLTRHLLWLRDSDPGAKSIIFSQYKEFLDVLALAFRRYRIGYTSFDKAHGITMFKEDPGTEVFLLHARAHASGLNLVNANHVFLCEPLLNTALELQAIARVDRIGQQHETTVWLYIVDGTVEESIHDLSVQRRMEHMGRNAKGKSKESTPELLDARLDEANALEMQQAHLSKLMGKDGILGEAVDKDDLWTCLFGHLHPKERREERDPENPELRRLLTINAVERRMEVEN